MIPEWVIKAKYSKNTATYNHWLSLMCVGGYDQLEYSGEFINFKGMTIGRIKHYTLITNDKQELNIPIFDFQRNSVFHFVNEKQISFWIMETLSFQLERDNIKKGKRS